VAVCEPAQLLQTLAKPGRIFAAKFEFGPAQSLLYTMSTRRALLKMAKKPSPPKSKCIFDLILTFRDLEQIFINPFAVPKGISEAGFVQAVFAELDDEKLAELVKISACIHFTPGEEIESWIPPREGKFYFNTEVNDDEDTIRWAAQKNAELVRRHKL
jgi:hypothetical protein